jgi:hypothetical protein
MTKQHRPPCQARYEQRSKRSGQRCTARATTVIRAAQNVELLVCGVHARGWIPRVQYPLGKVLTPR